MNSSMIKQKLQMAGWGALGLCCLVLLVAAMKTKSRKSWADIKINIEGPTENIFVTEKDIRSILKQNNINGVQEIAQINLQLIEDRLEKNVWIKEAELFFDNRQVLHVVIREREPIARVFTVSGNSFYIDSAALRLPLSDASVARIPVFTGFPSDRKKLSAPDSLQLIDVKNIAQIIIKDSFWNAQVAQINIASNGQFQIIPVLGNQVIVIGDAQNLEEKFQNLLCFYQQIWSKVGFEKYETVSAQYKGQIVAVRRGAPKPIIDSASAIQHLLNTENKLNTVVNDTSTSVTVTHLKSPAQQTVIKPEVDNKPISKTVTGSKNTGTTDKKKQVVEKPAKKDKGPPKIQPKAVMKKPGGNN